MPLSSWSAQGRPGQRVGEGRHLRGAVEAGHEVVVADEGGVAGHQAGEDVDRRAGAERRAQRRALLGERDEEAAGAGAGERGADHGGAEAVGVGLDHGGGLDRGRRERVERAPVGGDRVEVDGEAGAGHGGLLACADSGPHPGARVKGRLHFRPRRECV